MNQQQQKKIKKLFFLMEKLNSDADIFFSSNKIEPGNIRMTAGQMLIQALYEDIEQLYALYKYKAEFDKGFNECIENITEMKNTFKAITL